MRKLSIVTKDNLEIEFMYDNLILSLCRNIEKPRIKFVELSKINKTLIFNYQIFNGKNIIVGEYSILKEGDDYSFELKNAS